MQRVSDRIRAIDRTVVKSGPSNQPVRYIKHACCHEPENLIYATFQHTPPESAHKHCSSFFARFWWLKISHPSTSKEDFLQSVVVAAHQYRHIYRDVDSRRWSGAFIILREMSPTDFADLLAFPHFWLFLKWSSQLDVLPLNFLNSQCPWNDSKWF